MPRGHWVWESNPGGGEDPVRVLAWKRGDLFCWVQELEAKGVVGHVHHADHVGAPEES
jgi:hypothetical protein